MRTLIWHVPSQLRPETDRFFGPVYRLDKQYVPVRVWLHSTSAPANQPVKVDLFDDGESFIDEVALPVPQTDVVGRILSTKAFLEKDSLIQFKIIQADDAMGELTVGLELEEDD